MKKRSASDRLYRFLLRLLPFDFQREFGTEMEDVFRQERRNAKQRGILRLVRLWWDTITSVLRIAPTEHLDVLRRDVLYGIRSLKKSPGFVLIAITALALGIGANLTIFGFANALLFRAPAVPEASEVIQVLNGRWGNVPYASYVRYRDENQTLSGLAAFSNILVNLRVDGAPESEWAMTVTGNYFSTIKIAAARGRTIIESDDRPGAPGVVMLSDGFWRRRFGADTAVIGRSVSINGSPFTVIGVTPESFNGSLAPFIPAIWIPWNGPYGDLNRSGMLIGRLRRGATIARAQADLSNIAAALARELYDRTSIVQRGQLVTVYPDRVLHPELATPVGAFTGGLLALTVLVLLVACLNIASLLLARSSTRRREISVRIALGASRKQLVRQLLTESVLLTLGGSVAAAGIVFFAVRSIGSISLPIPIPIFFQFAVDWRLALFAGLLAVLATVVCGLAPALNAVRTDVIAAMKDSASASIARHSRLRATFIVGQLAVSALLLVLAALAVRSLSSPQSADRGFVVDNVLTAGISLPPSYTRDRSVEFHEQLLERLESLPGVVSANVAELTPLTLSNVGRAYETENGQRVPVSQNAISRGHFATLGISLLAGRDFSQADRSDASRVCIINERLARRLWPGETPVGKRLRAVDPQDNGWIEVIGLARDSKYIGISEDPKFFLYRPLGQQYVRDASLLVKTNGDPLSVVPAVRAALQQLDPEIGLTAVDPLANATEISLLPMRIAASAASILGVLALALGAIGIYGIVSYLVRNRTREIGIRMALGAQPSHVIRTVTADVIRWTAAGLGLGLGAALGISFLLRNLIYGVAAGDAVSFGGIALLLFVTACAACWIPARRACRIDPLNALREE